MKKVILFVAPVITMLFFSCTVCTKCTHASLPADEICRDQYETQSEFDNAVANAENIGYTCNP